MAVCGAHGRYHQPLLKIPLISPILSLNRLIIRMTYLSIDGTISHQAYAIPRLTFPYSVMINMDIPSCLSRMSTVE